MVAQGFVSKRDTEVDVHAASVGAEAHIDIRSTEWVLRLGSAPHGQHVEISFAFVRTKQVRTQ